MVIRISDIPPEGLTLELAQNLDLFDLGTATTAFQAVIGIRPASRGILRVTGKIRSSPVLECSRCLENFAFAIDTELDIELAPVGSLGAAAEHELAGGELDTEFYEGDVIEPVDLIKEQLLISIPMVPLHSPECKGLCSVCGTDLNKSECGHQRNAPGDFGAFSALKDLLKK
ncbi:MAG TPA: DUF177 domain-containing protein [Nitrospirota bacterium]|nr:DUF177 domain-containing protein [Nitrospirota bacterium]